MNLTDIQFSYLAKVANPGQFDGWRSMRVSLSRRLTYFMREFSEQVKITFSDTHTGAGEFQCTLRNVVDVERVYPDDMPFPWTIGIETRRKKNSHHKTNHIFISFEHQSYFDVAKKCILLHFQIFPNAEEERSPRSSFTSGASSDNAPCSLLEFLGVPGVFQRSAASQSGSLSDDFDPFGEEVLPPTSAIRAASVRWRKPGAWFSQKMQLVISESFLVFRKWKPHQRGEIVNILSLYAITSIKQDYRRGKPRLRVELFNGDTHRITFSTTDEMYHWLCDFRSVLKHDPEDPDPLDEQKLDWDLDLPTEHDPIYGVWMKLRGSRASAAPSNQSTKVANYEDERWALQFYNDSN